MFPSLRRATTRKVLAAGLATVVAAASIGVAVAAPSPPDKTPSSANEVVAESLSRSSFSVEDPEVESPPATEVSDVPAPEDDGQSDEGEGDVSRPGSPEVELDVAEARQIRTGVDRASAPTPSIPEDAELRRFLNNLQAGTDDADGDEVAGGAGDIAAGVAARIQECVGDVFGQFGDHFDFDDLEGSGGSGAPGEAGRSFATGVVDDVLPCVAGLVDDTLRCVSGLVEEILAVVMSMDVDRILGMVDVVIDELVTCVADAD